MTVIKYYVSYNLGLYVYGEFISKGKVYISPGIIAEI